MGLDVRIPDSIRPFMRIDGHVAYTVNQWIKIIEYNNTNHIKLTGSGLHRLFAEFGIQKYDYYKNDKIKLFRLIDVQNKLMVSNPFRYRFFDAKQQDSSHNSQNTSNVVTKQIDPPIWAPKTNRNGLVYYDGGPDMKHCSDFLIHQYNFESKCQAKSIMITEQQLNKLLKSF